MAVPRSAACARGWFPPATFQLRLRSLKSLMFFASSKLRGGHHEGYFFVTLHLKPGDKYFWKSSLQKWSYELDETRLVWNDIDLERCDVHLGTRSVVVSVWFRPEDISSDDDDILETTWGVYFSGLWCLGTHPPPRGRLPPDAIVFYLCGSFFSSADHIRDKGIDTFIPRYVHLGTGDDLQAVSSYDTELLSRLQKNQRALQKQEKSNHSHKKNLKLKGIIAKSDSEMKSQLQRVHEHHEKKFGHRLTIFNQQTKASVTRLRESELRAEIERAKVRVELLRAERARLESLNEEIESKRRSLTSLIEEKSSFLMRCFHTLAKEKANFREWMSEFQQDCRAHSAWSSALRRQRLALVHSMVFIFPIGNLDSSQPTIRYVALPAAAELRETSKNEVLVSVVVGWLADLLTVISRIFDSPLRYPIHLLGSSSSICDLVKSVPQFGEDEIQEFPLYVGRGNTDWSRFEYGLYLFTKNLSQLRWQCSLPTTDLKPVLKNINELMSLGEKLTPLSDADIDSLPKLKTLTSPPRTVDHHVVIKSGRALIPDAHRGGSPPKHQIISTSLSPVSTTNTSSQDNNYDDGECSSTESRSSSTTSFIEMASHDEDISKPSLSEDDKLSTNGSNIHDTSPVEATSKTSSPSDNTNQLNNVFWGQVASRTTALSNPSSFQRPRQPPS